MRRLLVVILLLAACERTSRKKPPTTGPQKPLPVPSGDFLVLAGHGPEQPEVTVVALKLEAAGGLAAQPARTLPALPHEGWDGHYRIALASDHGWLAYTAKTDAGTRITAERLDGGGTPQSETVAYEVAALHVGPEGLWIGGAGKVALASLSGGGVTELVSRDLKHKAYDVFARAGDRLIAIDDVVMPMLADWFDVSGGRVARLGEFDLPGIINGHYAMAAMSARDGGYTLYVVTPYGIMDGWGHELAALPIRGDKLGMSSDVTLNSGAGAGGPVIEEHVSRRTNQPERLIAGSEFTPFTGIAVEPTAERLLVAAGSRGLLVFPLALPAAAEVFATPASCLDVLVRGGRTYVLARDAAGDVFVIVLGWTGGKPVEVSRQRVGKGLDRFVD